MMLFMVLKMTTIHQPNKFGFVYKWINKINGHWYIGSHQGGKDDGYVGSGVSLKDAIRKHGIDNFEREILYEGDNFRDEETRILTELNAAKDLASYNHKNEAFGCSLPGELNGMFGKELTPEQRYKCGNAFRGKKRPGHSELMKGENNPMFGKTEHSHGLKKRAIFLRGKSFEEIYGEEKARQLKKKLCESHIGIKHKLNHVTCPKCNTIGKGPNMTRYHFDNCDPVAVDNRRRLKLDKKRRHEDRINRKQMSISLYEKGFSIDEIANQLNCSTLKIYRDLRFSNVELVKKHTIYEFVICPFCNKKGKGSNMTRYHFDNCKLYKDNL